MGSRICSGNRANVLRTAEAIILLDSPSVCEYTGRIGAALSAGRKSGAAISRRRNVPDILPRNKYSFPSSSRFCTYGLLKYVRERSETPSVTFTLYKVIPLRMRFSTGRCSTVARTTHTLSNGTVRIGSGLLQSS